MFRVGQRLKHSDVGKAARPAARQDDADRSADESAHGATDLGDGIASGEHMVRSRRERRRVRDQPGPRAGCR